MKNVIIVGSGAVAAELTSYIEDNNKHVGEAEQLNILGYLDSEENIPKYWARYKFKKKVIADLKDYQPKPGDHFIVGISHLEFRTGMIKMLEQKDANIIGFVHHSTIVADSAVLGIGNIIYPYCIVGPNTTIGNHNLFTGYSFVSHDCKIGSNNFFSTAGLSGNVSVGDFNFFGIRSTVLPNISIGSRNIVQAGMIVDKDIADDSTIFHRFKEKVISINKAPE